jgi:hypothetical protein
MVLAFSSWWKADKKKVKPNRSRKLQERIGDITNQLWLYKAKVLKKSLTKLFKTWVVIEI